MKVVEEEVEDVVEEGGGWRGWWGRRWSLHAAGGRSLFVFSLSASTWLFVCPPTHF
jgi:hypothetical protein